MKSRSLPLGFTLIELMVTLAIIALVMALAAPSVGSSVQIARERTVEQKMIQDFTWARGAAGAADASVLETGLTGTPTVVFTVYTNGTWTTNVTTPTNATTGVNDSAHSMDATSLAKIASISCAATSPLTMNAAFKFTPQGTIVGNTGTITCVGASTQRFPMNFIYSGSVFRTYGSTS